MRLIDADALIEAHYDYCNKHHGEGDVFYAWSLELMRNAPTVKPKRGKWEVYIISMIDGEGCRCSVCGFEGVPDWSYCPQCGARMEG